MSISTFMIIKKSTENKIKEYCSSRPIYGMYGIPSPQKFVKLFCNTCMPTCYSNHLIFYGEGNGLDVSNTS